MTANVLLFGKHHSDYMGVVDFDQDQGWSAPVIKPFEKLKLNPFVSCLHYGIQCFEGLKAYKNVQGNIRLFRPDCNARRLKKSSLRLSLPDFDGEEFINFVSEYIRMEERWIPPIPEFSFYIRPLHIATEPTLGIKKAHKSKLLVMGGPVGPYYPTGFKPISLSCTESTIRSAPKGTGAFKIGGYRSIYIETMLLLCKHRIWYLLKDINKCFGFIRIKLLRLELQTYFLCSKTRLQEKLRLLHQLLKILFYQE